MRLPLLLMSAILLTSTALSQTTGEKILVKCIYGDFKDLGINLKSEMKAFEEELVVHGFLPDKSGESYYHLYETMARSNSFQLLTDYESEELKDLMAAGHFYGCFNDDRIMQRLIDEESRLVTLGVELSKLQTVPFPTVAEIGQTYTRVLEPNDLEEELFRLMALWSFFEITQHQEDQIEQVTVDLEPARVGARNVLEIRVDPDRKVYVEGEPVGVDKLEDILPGFIRSDPGRNDLPEFEMREVKPFGSLKLPKQYLHFVTSPGIRYSQYLEVYSIIRRVYHQIWEEESKKRFRKPYHTLEDDRQAAIRALYPMRLITSNPN